MPCLHLLSPSSKAYLLVVRCLLNGACGSLGGSLSVWWVIHECIYASLCNCRLHASQRPCDKSGIEGTALTSAQCQLYMQLSTCTSAICCALMLQSLSRHLRRKSYVIVRKSASAKAGSTALPPATSLLRINLSSVHTVHCVIRNQTQCNTLATSKGAARKTRIPACIKRARRPARAPGAAHRPRPQPAGAAGRWRSRGSHPARRACTRR